MKTMKNIAVTFLALFAGAMVYFAYNSGPMRVACETCHQGWKMQVDQTNPQALDPSKNPYLREAFFGMQSELPLRRIVTKRYANESM